MNFCLTTSATASFLKLRVLQSYVSCVSVCLSVSALVWLNHCVNWLLLHFLHALLPTVCPCEPGDMLKCMSWSWNINTRAQPECWYFNWGTYTFSCHTSLSCIICFVTSITKIRLNSKNLHFTGMEPYDNYVMTSAGSKYAKIGECEATPTAVRQPMSVCDLESQIC